MLLFAGLQLLYNEQEGYQPPRKKRRRSGHDETQSAEHHQQIEYRPPNVRLDRRNPMTDVAPQDHQIHHMGCGLRANIQAEQHTEESIHFIAAGERVQKMEQTPDDDCQQNQSPHRFFIAVFRHIIHLLMIISQLDFNQVV